MGTKPDGERLATLETKVNGITEKTNAIENSVHELHGKFDDFTKIISENYVAKDTFDQYKETMKEKDKNKWLERVLTILITAAITGLVAFFFKQFGR